MHADLRRCVLSSALMLGFGLGATVHRVAAQDAQPQRPLVKIVATGGTIANSPEGRMAVDTVLAQIPEVAEHARIEVEDYSRIGSSAISVQNWIDIGAIVNQIFETEPEVAGIVITHGSNTSEETAYFLSLTVNHAKPVVVNAAQRQQKRNLKGSTLCRQGHHKWVIVTRQRFDVKQGKLVTVSQCSRCGKRKVEAL